MLFAHKIMSFHFLRYSDRSKLYHYMGQIAQLIKSRIQCDFPLLLSCRNWVSSVIYSMSISLLVIHIYVPQSLMSNADLHPCSWTVWLKTYFCTIPLELSAIADASDQPTVPNTWELEQPFYIHYKSQHAQLPTHVLLQEQAFQNKTSKVDNVCRCGFQDAA